MNADAGEAAFQQDIVDQMIDSGWVHNSSAQLLNTRSRTQ